MVNNLKALILDGLFPSYCALCGLRSDRPVPLCGGCHEDLLPNRHSCKRCALPLAGEAPRQGETLCGRCLTHPPSFERVIAPWQYSPQLGHLIQRWKYAGDLYLSGLLARLWMQAGQSGGRVDALVPVPLHWRRLWQRGYNQSLLLARELQRVSADPAATALRTDLVRRQRYTAPQAGLDAAERARNLRAAFTCREPCDNLRLAIVDDVLTTGATADALASTLHEAGAAYIEVWCLARTPVQASTQPRP